MPNGGIRFLLQVGCVALLTSGGCQQKMARQPSYRPLQESTFFADGQASRSLVEGVVARGHLRIDPAMYTGRVAFRSAAEPGNSAASNDENAKKAFQEPDFVQDFPFPVTVDVLEHGHHRFLIYCVVCHDPQGTGRGKIVERGYTQPPSYHIQRLRDAPPGRLFAVMSEGYGSMPSYAEQIPVRDRWAIAAYIKALQLSQHFAEGELTDQMRNEMAASHLQEAAR